MSEGGRECEFHVTFRVSGDAKKLGKWLEGNSHIAQLVQVEEVDRDV